MRFKGSTFIMTFLAAVVLAASTPAQAGIKLTFDASDYYIAGPGGTANVSVYAQQVAPLAGGEPVVDSANGLTGASIKLSIASPSIADVLSTGGITGGPAFDSASGGFDGSNNPNLGVLSLQGVDLVASPVLLGVFTFTGLSPGATLAISALLDPTTENFTDANLDNLDAYVTGSSATIHVGGLSTVPEPPTIISGGVAALFGLAELMRRSVRGRLIDA